MHADAQEIQERGVSPEELSQWLRSAGLLGEAASVSTFTSERIGDGLGFTGSLERLTLTYTGDAPQAPPSVILKQASGDEEVREAMATNGLYEKEVRFYNELAKDSDVLTPACYFAAYDKSGDFRLVLEDIGHGTTLDQLAGATKEQARGIVKALAQLHAGWWRSERLNALDWAHLSDELIDETKRRYREGLPGLYAATGKRHPELCGYAKKLDALLDSIDLAEQSEHFTLGHGDFRLDNIFVRPEEPDRFFFADWQLVSVGLGSNDLARFLAESLETPARREIQAELFELCHSTLVAGGVRGFSLRQLRQEYSNGLLTQLVLLVVAADALEWHRGGGRGQELAETLTSRLESAMVDQKIGRLLLIAPWAIRVQNGAAWLKRTLRIRRRTQAT